MSKGLFIGDGEISDVAEGIQDDPLTTGYAILECKNCNNTVLALDGNVHSMTCHGEPMEHATHPEIKVREPGIREVLCQVFGLPKTGLDICLYVIGEGPLSTNEVAGSLGYDRSTVTRYLNKLVKLGLLCRSELNREEGGVVYVYHSVDLEHCRREMLIGFCVWAGEVATLIQETNHTMQRYLEMNPDRTVPDVFWESVPDE